MEQLEMTDFYPTKSENSQPINQTAWRSGSPEEEEYARQASKAIEDTPEDDISKRKSRFRLYLVRTFFLYFAYLCLGLEISEGGVTLLDIMLLLRTDIQKGSIFYTVASVGYCAGAFLSGFLYDIFDWDGLLFVALSCMGALNIGFVYSPTMWLMVLLNGIKGLTLGSLDTGGNTVCVGMWKKEGSPYLQALHLSFSVGGVIGPFIADPFLAPKPNATSENSTTGTSSEQLGSSSYYGRLPGSEFFGNTSSMSLFNLTTADVPKTRVEYVYIIIGAITVFASLPFLCLFVRTLLKRKSVRAKVKVADVKSKANGDSSNAPLPAKELSLKLKIMMLIMLGAFYASYVSLEAFIEGYLMTFVVRYLDWSKTQGARITSIFWGTFAGGRLLGILTAKLLSPWKMLLLDLILVNAVLIPLWFVTKERDIIIWICIPLSGVFMATIFPTGISWTNQKIMRVSGKVASVFILSSTIGGIINPMLLGYLFKNITPMWFVYLIIMYGILCILIFFTLTAILRMIGRKSHVLSVSADIQ